MYLYTQQPLNKLINEKCCYFFVLNKLYMKYICLGLKTLMQYCCMYAKMDLTVSKIKCNFDCFFSNCCNKVCFLLGQSFGLYCRNVRKASALVIDCFSMFQTFCSTAHHLNQFSSMHVMLSRNPPSSSRCFIITHITLYKQLEQKP